MSKYYIKQLLMSSNYWTLNKDVVKMFGIETAFMLSNLAEAESMMADDDGWFYQTHNTVESMTGLSRHKQDVAIDKLEKEGILHKKVRGIPAKRYFKLDYKCLANKFAKNQQTSMRKISKLDCEKLPTNKESNINKVNKESINKDTMPSSNEHDRIPYLEIVEYLNEKTNSQYRPTSKKTQALIKARYNDGFNIDDFKIVIDNKTTEWYNDVKMSKFLRPETLFGTKFESYLNQKVVNDRTEYNANADIDEELGF